MFTPGPASPSSAPFLQGAEDTVVWRIIATDWDREDPNHPASNSSVSGLLQPSRHQRLLQQQFPYPSQKKNSFVSPPPCGRLISLINQRPRMRQYPRCYPNFSLLPPACPLDLPIFFLHNSVIDSTYDTRGVIVSTGRMTWAPPSTGNCCSSLSHRRRKTSVKSRQITVVFAFREDEGGNGLGGVVGNVVRTGSDDGVAEVRRRY